MNDWSGVEVGSSQGTELARIVGRGALMAGRMGSDLITGGIEVPTGVVPLDSPFYIERAADAQLRGQLRKLGTLTTIRGARQTGKTSLLVRGVDYAGKRDALIIHLDFQQVSSSLLLSDMDDFFRNLVFEIANQAQVDLSLIDSIWESSLNPQAKITQFVEELVLKVVDGPVVLAMDEVDILLRAPFYGEFFGLLRAWNNRRASDNIWKKLDVVIAVSTHPSLLIDDIHQSSFNVGLVIELDDFGRAQVQDLNRRHGKPLRPEEISEAMALLGGHPFLIRQALYTLVVEGMTWPELAAVADGEEGPFGGHLRYHLNLLHGDEGLMEAMRKVVTEGICPEHKVFLRLSAAGLVRRKGRKCVCRYGLYEKFFRNTLLWQYASC